MTVWNIDRSYNKENIAFLSGNMDFYAAQKCDVDLGLSKTHFFGPDMSPLPSRNRYIL
jgi:hypothetical protein